MRPYRHAARFGIDPSWAFLAGWVAYPLVGYAARSVRDLFAEPTHIQIGGERASTTLGPRGRRLR